MSYRVQIRFCVLKKGTQGFASLQGFLTSRVHTRFFQDLSNWPTFDYDILTKSHDIGTENVASYSGFLRFIPVLHFLTECNPIFEMVLDTITTNSWTDFMSIWQKNSDRALKLIDNHQDNTKWAALKCIVSFERRIKKKCLWKKINGLSGTGILILKLSINK